MDLSKTKLADLGTMSGINSSAGSDVALPAGKVIADRFEIIGVIGQGGMGTVYEAYDQMREDQVALKFLRPEFVSSDNARQRFLNEAKIAISLSHPNIISVYDVVKYENTCFLTMELLKGQSLRQRLHDLAQASEVMPVNEAMSIAKDVCEALANAHKSTIHRDIKPENIWLLPDGRAKLMDFGIARLQDQTSGLTKTSAVLGTAYYMAPEQLVGTGQIDHRADQYSLGVVLFEMLTGTLPIGRHAAVSAMRKGINKKIDPVIETMLSGKMGERYPDDKALLEALNKVPVSETGGGLPKGAGKAVAAAVLLIAVAGAGYGGWQWMEQKAKNEVIRLAEEQAKAEALAKAKQEEKTKAEELAKALAKAKQADEETWSITRKDGKLAGYQTYLNQFPAGAHGEEAKKEVERLKLAQQAEKEAQAALEKARREAADAWAAQRARELAEAERRQREARSISAPISVQASSGNMPQLARERLCAACHAIDKKVVGPSWLAVAKKYRGDPAAEDKLVLKVSRGGAGVWGSMPMPAHPKMSKAEITALVRFILGLSN